LSLNASDWVAVALWFCSEYPKIVFILMLGPSTSSS